MTNTIQISEDITVAGQPSKEQLRQLSEQGFKSVVNFRNAGEEDQPLSPQEEGELIHAAGMTYLHAPVSMRSISPELVDQFREQFAELPAPIFAHCKGGTRAGIMITMHLACEKGMTGEQALRQAEQMGFPCNQPELKKFVQSYVDEHEPINTTR